jgi:HEPN domain-containing protein
MKTDETNPQDWFLLAAERLSAADVLYGESGSTYSGIEILQEAVERYLKGFLIAKGWRLRKVHDLTLFE